MFSHKSGILSYPDTSPAKRPELPFRVTSLTWLIVLLFLAQPLIIGCTAVGYGIGQSADDRLAKMEEVADLGQLQKGDRIYLVVQGHHQYRGKIVRIQLGDFISVKFQNPRYHREGHVLPRTTWEVETVNWDQIQEIYIIHVRPNHRIAGAVVGLLLDTAVVMFFLTMRQVGKAIESMGA